MHTAFQIMIPRRSSACAGGGEKFEPKQTYHSVVREDDGGEFVRLDYCSPCWEKIADELKGEEIVHWKGQVPAKVVQNKLAGLNRDERALVILKELLQKEELSEKEEEEAFVLGVFLARQRVLYARKQLTKDGKTFQIYEKGGGEEILAVPHKELSVLEVSTVQQQIAQKLKGS